MLARVSFLEPEKLAEQLRQMGHSEENIARALAVGRLNLSVDGISREREAELDAFMERILKDGV